MRFCKGQPSFVSAFIIQKNWILKVVQNRVLFFTDTYFFEILETIHVEINVFISYRLVNVQEKNMRMLTFKCKICRYFKTSYQIKSNPSISGIFLKFPKSWVVRQLVRQHVDLLSGDYNLGPFHLRWRNIVLKSEKVYKYFVQDCRLFWIRISICRSRNFFLRYWS